MWLTEIPWRCSNILVKWEQAETWLLMTPCVLLGLLISISHSAAKIFVISDVFCQVFYLGCFLISIFLAAVVFNHEGIVLKAIIWCAFQSKNSRPIQIHVRSSYKWRQGVDLEGRYMKGSQISYRSTGNRWPLLKSPSAVDWRWQLQL